MSAAYHGAGTSAGFSPAAMRTAIEQNAIAQRALRIVAEGVGGAPIIASDDGLKKLVMASSAGQSLVETLAMNLMLHGTAHVQIIHGAGERPAELFALRPDRITVECDDHGWPIAYVYRMGEHVRRLSAFDMDGRPEILAIHALHPLEDHKGLGCLQAASRAIAVHEAASRWNQALLDNAARPSGALIHDPGENGLPLSQEQFDRLKNELESSFAGAAHAGRPMVLEGSLKWQGMGLTPADMDFVALKASAARDIALAFGVPPMLLGLPGDNSYANYKEANRALWRLTLLPLSHKILGALAEGLDDWWPGAALRVDLDQITALAEDRERLWDQVSRADFLSDSEKRALLGLGEQSAD